MADLTDEELNALDLWASGRRVGATGQNHIDPAWVASAVAELRRHRAQPAPVLSEADREALEWARQTFGRVTPHHYVRGALAALDRLLATPQPAPVDRACELESALRRVLDAPQGPEEHEAMAAAREMLDGARRSAPVDRGSGAVSGPAGEASLCVAEALRDERVRAGTHVVERVQGEWQFQYQVCPEGDVEERYRTKGGARAYTPWWGVTLTVALLDAPCTIIPAPTEAP